MKENIMKKLWNYGWNIYRQHEEGFNYLIFGFLAFVLNYLLYALFEGLLGLHYIAATVLSWVLAVIFAYWTNRNFVFKSKNQGSAGLLREFTSFIGARIATELLELLLMYLLVDVAGANSYAAKIVGQIAVIVSNYFLSKLWIFKEKK